MVENCIVPFKDTINHHISVPITLLDRLEQTLFQALAICNTSPKGRTIRSQSRDELCLSATSALTRTKLPTQEGITPV